MTASVIIRTYNEEQRLLQCLQAVFSQQTTFPFEVIVVDSESTDKTLSIASRFPVKILHIPKKEFTYGKALNIGGEAAEGQYLVFLSGDAVPENERWLGNLIRNFDVPDVAGVYGKQIPFPDCDPFEKRLLTEGWPRERQIQTVDPFFSVANAATRKEIWETTRFNETIAEAEEQEWAMKVQKLKRSIIYEPEAAVTHSHNADNIQACKKFYKEIHGLYVVHGEAIFSHFLLQVMHTPKRDISYIRAHGCGTVWILRSVVRNGLFSLALCYAVAGTPHGRAWLFSRLWRLINPMRIIYKLSFALKQHSPAYAALVASVKARF